MLGLPGACGHRLSGIAKFTFRPRLNWNARQALQLDRVVESRCALAAHEDRDVGLINRQIARGVRLSEAPAAHPILQLFGSRLHRRILMSVGMMSTEIDIQISHWLAYCHAPK